MRQVITIEPGGIMSGLQRKPGQGLDLREFGKCSIERASEICWDDTAQKWFVKITSRHQGFIDRYMTFISGAMTELDFECMTGKFGDPNELDPYDDGTAIAYFDNYDDAVKAEIEFLDAARLKGLLT